MSWLLIEEVLDSIAVVAVVSSAIYWWKASHLSHESVRSDPAAQPRMNARAATHAAIAATLQALAVMTHVFGLANWVH